MSSRMETFKKLLSQIKQQSAPLSSMILRSLQSNTPPPPSPPSLVSSTTTNPTCLKDLIKIARERGMKYQSRMSKSQLCEVLGVSLVRPNKYIFENKETGEQRGFTSLYHASKELGVNPGLIQYYMGKEMRMGDERYVVSKL